MPFDSASTAAFSPRKDFVKNSHTGADVLDICSSWVSHYPQDLKLGRVAGTGMNERELRANTQLTEFTPVWKSKFYGAIRIAASTSTPSTRHLLCTRRTG